MGIPIFDTKQDAVRAAEKAASERGEGIRYRIAKGGSGQWTYLLIRDVSAEGKTFEQLLK